MVASAARIPKLRGHILPIYAELKMRGLKEQLRTLERSQYFSGVELVTLQEQKLRELVRSATTHVPYYREQFGLRGLTAADVRTALDLRRLPIIGKQEITSNYGRFLSTEAGRQYSVRRTSGSTGTPYKIAIDHGAMLVEQAAFYRFLFSIGYVWGDRVIKLWGAPVVVPREKRLLRLGRRWLRESLWNIKSFDAYKLDERGVAAIMGLLEQGPASIARGYVSAIYLIARELLERGLKPQVKAVATTAEKLFAYQRQTIERAFEQKMFDQYGCGESNSIAFECERHTGLHVASEHVIVELLDDKDEPVANGAVGRVVITDLDNVAMPLIRYANGDLASWAGEACPCGRGLPLLRRIEGRAYEILTVPGRRRIHGGFFDEIYVEMKLGDRYAIDDLRVVQEDLYNYRLEFVMRGVLEKEDVEALKRKYREYVGDVSVQVKYVESIPPTKTGKRLFVIPAGSE